MKVRFIPPTYITVSWWQGLPVTNYGIILCVTIMSLCSSINHVCTLDRSNIFSKSGCWLTCLRQHKTSILSSLCHWRETQLQLEQIECLRLRISPAARWLLILLIHIGSQVKTRRQSYKFKFKFLNLKKKSHATHLLKLLEKMCKYDMGIRQVLLMIQSGQDSFDRRTDGQVDGRTSFSMNKPTTWYKSGRVSLVSSSCLYKTQPERALAQVCHTRIDALSPDEYQFHLLLHRNSHHSQATYPKWLNH